MPSQLMTSKDETLDDMNRFLVDDLKDCFYDGVQARSIVRFFDAITNVPLGLPGSRSKDTPSDSSTWAVKAIGLI